MDREFGKTPCERSWMYVSDKLDFEEEDGRTVKGIILPFLVQIQIYVEIACALQVGRANHVSFHGADAPFSARIVPLDEIESDRRDVVSYPS